MVENEWRAENCPDFGAAYCQNPYPYEVCEGAWDCDYIEEVFYEVMAYYNTDGNEYVNPEDDIEEEHYAIMLEYCDFNNDGNLHMCEIHACIVEMENAWRAENCPDYGFAYCPCPVDPEPVCEGAWNCADVAMISEEVMNEFDTNNDD